MASYLSPGFEKSDQLIEDIQTIDGIPQPIVKIPLRNIPERGLVGIEVHQLVDRIIVGPSVILWKCVKHLFLLSWQPGWRTPEHACQCHSFH